MERLMKRFPFQALVLTSLLLTGCAYNRASPHAATGITADARTEEAVRALLDREPELVAAALDKANRKRRENEVRAHEEMMRPFAQQILVNADGTYPAFGVDLPASTIVEAMDYNCSYCKRFHNETVKPLLAKGFRLRVKILWSPILGPGSRRMSELAAAAQLQGKFPAAHAFLIEQRAADREAADKLIPGLIAAADLNRVELMKALADGSAAKLVDTHEATTQKIAVRGTPALWVADRLVEGAISAEELEQQLTTAPTGRH
jgi:protein-disulfide isomerase